MVRSCDVWRGGDCEVDEVVMYLGGRAVLLKASGDAADKYRNAAMPRLGARW